MGNEVKAVVIYLKQHKEYKRILEEILKKYKKLGKLSGFIYIENLTEEEGHLLASIDYKFYTERKGKLSVKKFVQKFSETKFKQVDFLHVLKEYFKDDIVTNKEKKLLKQMKKEDYFSEILQMYNGTRGEVWLQHCLEDKKYGYNIVIKKYNRHSRLLKLSLEYLRSAIENLSFSNENLKPLALFSSVISKDSHYFDTNREEGKLLIHYICFSLDKPYPGNSEETNEILYRAGIIRDEISNSTITFGLRGRINGEEHLGLKSFLDLAQPIGLSIRNLSHIAELTAKNNIVYVFENPTVFKEVLDKVIEYKPTLLCTSGQLNLSSLIILDKLVDNGAIIYYSGDFDPEGLQIADKLKCRYGEKLFLWRFTEEDYIKTKSNVSIKSRESKLNIKSEELFDLRDLLIAEGVAGYQELLIERYIKDIETQYT